MDFLIFLKENLRFPLLNRIMQLITYCGEETVFMAVALILFWCVDKWKGYFILAVGFLGTILNQFLKLVFRVPRPWTADAEIIVPSAKAGASGFTFPSGHTQNAVGTFGGIARTSKKTWVRILCPILILLIGFSRMYLGAHYPEDVLVSLGTGLVLLLVLHPILRKARSSAAVMYTFLGVMTLIAVAYVLYANLTEFPAKVAGMEQEEVLACYVSGRKNGFTLLGALLGLIVSYTADRTINFREQAPLLGQILKVVLGLAGILLIRMGLSKLFGLISGALYWNAVRYFVMVVFAGCIWPLTFPTWQKIGKKKQPV